MMCIKNKNSALIHANTHGYQKQARSANLVVHMLSASNAPSSPTQGRLKGAVPNPVTFTLVTAKRVDLKGLGDVEAV